VGEPETVARCFLVVTTEWDSKNGGLSTFNRLLCKALASAKQKAVCYVPVASGDEIRRAAEDGVRLIPANPEAGVAPMATLLIPPEEIKCLSADFIIGHDRQSGGYAKVIQKRDFPQSKRIHFIHTAPEEIEASKPSRAGTAAKRGEERVKEQKEEAKDAVLIVGVGPRLAREFANHVHGAGYAPVHELTPGFDLESETPNAAAPITLPPGLVCLVLGRSDDYELKGLDLAAQSMSAVADSWKPMVLPKLVVRGAPEGKGDKLFKKLRGDILSKRQLPITVREYSEDLEAIQNDLRGASLLLMPSCVEGFGLVAMEAICMGVPVLVSEQSGIAEVLPDTAHDVILSTRPDALTPLDPEVTKTWAEAIARVLNGREKAFAAARTLKFEMAAKYTWQEAIRAFLTALGVLTP
jgi:glycosyltransferase involved in cell wall biosynthesis